MDENLNKEQPTGCKMCGHGHCRGHFIMRWLLALAVLLLIFFLGLRLGELKGSFSRGYHHGGFNARYQRPMIYNTPPTMMRPGFGNSAAQSTASTTPSK